MTPLVSRAPGRILQVLPAALIMLALIAAPAVAQQGEIDATEGNQIGPLGLTPRISWQTEYDDNIYRRSAVPVSDVVSTISFTTGVRSQLRRVGLTGSAAADWMHFATHERERGANVGTALKMDLLLNRLTPYVSTSYVTSRRRLDPEIDSRSRSERLLLAAGSALRVGGKTSLDFSAGRHTVDYEQYAMADGVSLSQALNRESHHVALSLVQDVTPLTRIQVTGEMRRDIFHISTRRNADYMRLTTGFESSGRIRGHARVGVRILKPHDPSLAESRGLFVAVGTSTTVGDRLQISVDADRDVNPSYRPDSAYYDSYGYGGALSYAMRRSLRLSATAERRYADYSGRHGLPPSANDRDLLNSYGSAIAYQLGTALSFNLGGTYTERTSSFLARRFNGMILRAGVSHAF